MVETPDRQLSHAQSAGSSPSSTADMKAAIRNTRARLSARLAGTADHVDAILTHPIIAPATWRDGGVVDVAVNAIAAFGRANRAWSHAKSTGRFRRAAVVAVVAGIAVAIAAKTRHA